MAALWTCPACGRAFANANQSHVCGGHELEPHFEGRSTRIRAIYDALRLDAPDQLAALRDHALEAYAVGRQEHLR